MEVGMPVADLTKPIFLTPDEENEYVKKPHSISKKYPYTTTIKERDKL